MKLGEHDPRHPQPTNEEPFPQTGQRDKQGRPMRRYSVTTEMSDARPPRGTVVPGDDRLSPYAIAAAAFVLLAFIVVAVLVTVRS